MSKSLLLLVVLASVILYDAMAAYVSQILQIEYSYFGIGSLVIYFLSGLFATWKFDWFMGIAAGFISGLADATFGLLVSELVGPYTIYDLADPFGSDFVFVTAVVTGQSAIVGSFGTLAAHLFKNRAATRQERFEAKRPDTAENDEIS